MSTQPRRGLFFSVVAVVVIAAGAYVWQRSLSAESPPGFFVGQGRIEVAEVEVETEYAGTVKKVLVKEGDIVEAGQVVVQMDTQALERQLREHLAKTRQLEGSGLALAFASQRRHDGRAGTAELLTIRRQGKAAAMTAVVQNEGAVLLAENDVRRSEELVAQGLLAVQRLEADRARLRAARVLLSVARSQVAEAQVAIDTAESGLGEASSDPDLSAARSGDFGSAMEVASAVADKLQADITDGTLRTPRSGRVLPRIAKAGDALPAGGRVLTIMDLADVGLSFSLPDVLASKVSIGDEVRMVLDTLPQHVIPARLSYFEGSTRGAARSSDVAVDRSKPALRCKAKIDPAWLKAHHLEGKVGVTGVVYVRLDVAARWPQRLQTSIPPVL